MMEKLSGLVLTFFLVFFIPLSIFIIEIKCTKRTKPIEKKVQNKFQKQSQRTITYFPPSLPPSPSPLSSTKSPAISPQKQHSSHAIRSTNQENAQTDYKHFRC